MMNLMQITRVVHVESEKEDNPVASEADSENLDDVEASVDDLVSKGTIPPSPSLVSDTTIRFYEGSGFFSKRDGSSSKY